MSLDLDLFERACAGDGAALGALIDRHAPSALGLALAITADPSRAETIVVDAFAELVERGDQVVARGPVAFELLALVRRRALAAPSATIPRDDEAGAISRVVLVPDDLSPEAREAHRAMARLSPDERRSFELAYFRGLAAVDVAARLGIDPSAVRAHLAAALDELLAARARLDAADEASDARRISA